MQDLTNRKKMKEVTVLASNTQVQMKEQEQKMVEQSSNDLNQIKDQIQELKTKMVFQIRTQNWTMATKLYLKSYSGLKRVLVTEWKDSIRQMTVFFPRSMVFKQTISKIWLI